MRQVVLEGSICGESGLYGIDPDGREKEWMDGYNQNPKACVMESFH